MKKVSLFLIFTILISCFAGMGVSAVVYEDFLFEGYYGDGTQTVTSATAWGNHLFVSAADGLQIYNINTNELEAKWNLKSNSVIPTVGSSFVPSSTVVTEDYIIILSTMNHIAVFPNEGLYTNTPPKLIRRLGLFNGQPRMLYEDGYLYILDQVGAATVRGNGTTTYLAESGSVVLWKVDINNIENFAYAGAASLKYSGLNVASMISNGYAELINLGKRDYCWGQIAVKDGKLYAVTYNDTATAPYKTLYLHNIDLDTMTDTELVVTESTPAGLSVSFFTETGVVNQIKTLEVYEVDNPDNKKVISGFGRNVQVSCTEYTDGSFYTTVYFKNVADFETYLGASEEELSSGSKKFAIDYNEVANELTYSENTESLSMGALAVKDGKVILMTGTGARGQSAILAKPNYGYLVNADTMEVTKDFFISLMPDNGNGKASAVQSAVVVGDYLVYFVKQVSNNAAILDLTDMDNFSESISGTVHIPTVIGTSSVLSQAFVHGGYIYYPAAKQVAAVSTTAYVNKLSVKENVTKFPVIITGESSEGGNNGSVMVTVDSMSAEVDARGGAYALNVLSMPNGEYEVSANGELKTVTVDVPDAVEITDITAESEVAFTAVNNTDKYLNEAKDIKFVAVSYDESGNFIDKTEITKTCNYGEETDVTMTMPETETGGYIMIYPLSGSVLLDVPTKADATKADRTISFAEDKEITATATVNAADKVVTVTGQYIPGADLFAETVKDEIETVDVKHIRVSEDGTFEYTYSYSDDIIAGTSTYALTLTDSQTSKTVDFECSDDANFEAAMTTLKENVNSGTGLVTYFNENPEVAAALGIDIEYANYKTLNNSNKIVVMTEVYNKIASNEYTGLKTVFEGKATETKTKQNKENALSAVKGATVSTLTGILETYKDVYGISDSLWNEYTNIVENDDTDAKKVNKYFIGKTITSLSDVPYFLNKAVESLDDEDDDPTPSGGGVSGNSGGSYQSGNTQTVLTPVVTPAAKMFDDVADNHWAKSCIEELAKEGVINGIGNRLYAPDDYVTREQMVKILIEAFGMSKTGATADYADVDKNEWYYPYIASATEIGLAEGDGVNFGTGNYVTRQDATVMLYRMAGILDTEITGDKTTFTDDAEIADYAKEAVYKMQGSGVINGTGANKFSPNEPCTRAMAAKIVYELKKICGR